MEEIALNMYETAGLGVLALLLGMFLTKKFNFLKRMCIPAPVSGGIIFSLLTLLIHYAFDVDISFDGTIKDICMILFFTAVGYQSNLKVLKQGGKVLVMIIVLVFVLIVAQNILSVCIAKTMGINPLIGMATGSIPMCGGHGTAGGFSSLLESMGLEHASSITMAAATFGLVAGSLIGGPIAESLIKKNNLAETSVGEDVVVGIEASDASPEAKEEKLDSGEKAFRENTKAIYQLVLALAAGNIVSKLLALTGLTFPTYFGALLTGAIIRNVCEYTPKLNNTLKLDKIVSFGNICLNLFLGMAMISLKLWELASLALPLCVILISQVAFIALFAYFTAFPLLGKDYDAAVIVSGICGFGLGATPNAMANMSAVCYKYRYAVKPFLLIPIVGAMFVDIINTTVITIFLNLI